jgi:hypothetical protein
MSILYRGHSIDASYQMLVHFGKAISEEKISFYKKIASESALSNEPKLRKMHLWNILYIDCSFRRDPLTNKAVSDEKLIKKSTNQKQELPLTAMFVYRSGRNEQCL